MRSGNNNIVDDQGENDDGPAPVGNVIVQPLEHVEDRVGDEFHPAKIYEAVERRIHVLQHVVILGADVDAQCEELAGRTRLLLSGTGSAPGWPLICAG